MLNLYTLSTLASIFFTVFLLLGIVVQIMRLFFLRSQHEFFVPKLVLVNEILLLFHFLFSSFLISSTNHLFFSGIIGLFFERLRFLSLAPLILSVVCAFIYKERRHMINVLFLLPILLFWNTALFSAFFLSCNFLLVMSISFLFSKEWENSKRSVTLLSIKETTDLLSDGILYGDSKGKILIENRTMVLLSQTVELNPIRNTEAFWEQLQKLQNSADMTVRMLDNKLLLRLRNKGSWMISYEKLTLQKKSYTQILALDISDEDLLNKEIEDTNDTLEITGKEISEEIKNIETLAHERAILQMKIQVHDMLGQRLSILHQFLENIDTPGDISQLKPLLLDLNTAIKTNSRKASVSGRLLALKESFEAAGLTIHMVGSLPEDTDISGVFIETLRECATNAIRHAGAKNIYATLSEETSDYLLSVRNDGGLPSKIKKEGGGITGMRYRAREWGGHLEIITNPAFQVVLSIPKTKKEHKND